MSLSRRAVLALPLAGCARRGSVLRLVTYQGAETPQLARSLGVFEKHGLRVELTELTGASKVMESLLGGSADAILGTYDQALAVNARGRRVTAFLLLSECHCLGLVSRRVSSLADLRGRTVGVSAPGGPMQHFVTYLLRRAGLDPSSVAFASVGIGPSSVTAVEHNVVDAAVVFHGSYLELQRRNPALHVLAETYSRQGARAALGVETFPSTSLLARSEWFAAHRDEARRLVRAFRDTVAWARSHSVDEVLARVDPSTRRETLAILIPMLSPSGLMTREAAQLSLDVLGVKLTTPLDQTFTNEFLDAPVAPPG